ncbi:MAG: 50S ribosomal protein L10 [Flavobacteriales bacterium]|nr:50S ribosomal protein L10 [Flavobacteriales bacterium]
MTRAEKTNVIADLKEKFGSSQFFYIADSSTLTVEQINQLRGLCFKNDIEMKVVKNTLAIKALEQCDAEKNFEGLYSSLKGPTTIFFTEVGNAPAKMIKEFRKANERPILKAAYIDTAIYEGDDQIETLSKLKSRDELIGEIISILQSPAKNVISSLQSGGSKLSGILKTLGEREG